MYLTILSLFSSFIFVSLYLFILFLPFFTPLVGVEVSPSPTPVVPTTTGTPVGTRTFRSGSVEKCNDAFWADVVLPLTEMCTSAIGHMTRKCWPLTLIINFALYSCFCKAQCCFAFNYGQIYTGRSLV